MKFKPLFFSYVHRKKVNLFLCLVLVLGALVGCTDLVDHDQTQRGVGTFVLLESGRTVGQTFIAHHSGLSGIEIWLEPMLEHQGEITLYLKSTIQAEDTLLVSAMPIAQVTTPGFYRFSFAPQSDSHGQDFYVFLEVTHNASPLNVAVGPGMAYLDGAGYYEHQPVDAQLAFRLIYTPQFMALDLVGAVIKGVGLMLVTGLLYVIPGWALLAWFWPGKSLSWAKMLALSVGVSLAFYPLLLLWTDFMGLHLGRLYAWLPVGGGLGALIWRYRTLRVAQVKEAFQQWLQSETVWPDVTLILLIGLIFGVRLLVVRTVDVPMWGDSYQHTVMAQLLLDNDGLFKSWQPYAPYRSLTVHFGFPLATALLSWFTNLGSVQATLLTGQIVNVLAIVTLYPLTVRIAKDNRWAGVVAVLVAGLVSPTPSVYVNWGRYAQLTGQAILPVALWFLCEAVEHKKPWRGLVLAGITLGGMVLNYYRMPFYYAVFVLAWLVGWGIPQWGKDFKSWGQGFGRLALIAGVGVLLFLPWVRYLQGGRLVYAMEAGVTQGSPAQEVLTSYRDWRALNLYVPKALVFIFAMGFGLSLVLRRWSVAFMGLWAVGWAGLVAAQLLHIPGANLMQHFAIMIALYIPVSIMIGWVIGEGLRGALCWSPRWGPIAVSALGVLVALYFGVKQIGIINPAYMLVTRPDRRAMAWIREHTPEEALFLVEGFSIYGGWSAVGADAGWWIPLLTGRDTTMPPQYAMMNEASESPDYTRRVVDLTMLLETTPPISDAGLVALCDWGITHVYIGQGQGKVGSGAVQLFSPDIFIGNGYFQQVYHQDRVYIFAFDATVCEPEALNESGVSSTQSGSHRDDFSAVVPIWPHDQPPAAHEVALFRHTFDVARSTTMPQVQLFADTRYEVWLDGRWLGRGPARFSKQTREYDVYDLEQMLPGPHLLAVLVQWAPNARRSESVTPILQVQLQDERGVIATTGNNWKAQVSDAWRKDAALVHSWGILGPTELLDLRRLPAQWMTWGYVDESWPTAVEKHTVTDAVYQPRSIAPLVEVLATPIVREMGALSPGRAVYALSPTELNYHEFEVITSTQVALEVLAWPTLSLTETVRIDNAPLLWQAAGILRPDVYRADVALVAGTHQLAFEEIPETGVTFSLSNQNIQSGAGPLTQGRHAGRRLLLAEPLRQTVGTIITTEAGINLTFEQTPAYVVLDLGRVTHGRWEANLTGAPGTIVDVGWDERLWQNRRPLPHPGSLHEAWNQTDSWVLDGTSRTVSTLDARAGRYLLLAVWGDAPVTLNNVRVYEERYPLAQRGTFTSASPLLNEIWQVGVETLYVNMTDAYADPLRERGQWWGDAHVAFYMNLAAFGDTDLFKRGLLFMAEAFDESGRPPAFAPQGGDRTLLVDYGMLWVQSVMKYWQLTEDEALLEEVYPIITTFMTYLAHHENPTTGLLDIPEGHWSQTSVVDWAASYYDRWGQSTVLNALYYKTLVDAAAVADARGDETNVRLWQAQAMTLKSQINATLYLPEVKRYALTIANDELILEAPHLIRPHPQVWALANGVVPEAQVDVVTDAMLAVLSPEPEKRNLEIYGMFWLLEALGQTGRIAEAVDIIENYYGYVLALGATTWWEHFDSHLRYAASLSHAWGGAPTWFLSHYVLGARWEGGNVWSVTPAFVGVDYARGTLPLGTYGDLTVAWQQVACKPRTVSIVAPLETHGRAIIAITPDMTQVALNGQVIWRAGVAISSNIALQANTIYVPLMGGEHHFEINAMCP